MGKITTMTLILVAFIIGGWMDNKSQAETSNLTLDTNVIFLPSENGAHIYDTLFLKGYSAEAATGARVGIDIVIGPGKLELREGCYIFIKEPPAQDIEVTVLPRRIIPKTKAIQHRGE